MLTDTLKKLLEKRRRERTGESAPSTPAPQADTFVLAPSVVLTALDLPTKDEFSEYF